MELQYTADGTPQLVEHALVRAGAPSDNLSADSAGNVWAATFPKIQQVPDKFNTPSERSWSSTVLRIKRAPSGPVEKKKLHFEITKVLEDRDAEAIDGATSVVHDVLSGRLFLSGRLGLVTNYRSDCGLRYGTNAQLQG